MTGVAALGMSATCAVSASTCPGVLLVVWTPSDSASLAMTKRQATSGVQARRCKNAVCRKHGKHCLDTQNIGKVALLHRQRQRKGGFGAAHSNGNGEVSWCATWKHQSKSSQRQRLLGPMKMLQRQDSGERRFGKRQPAPVAQVTVLATGKCLGAPPARIRASTRARHFDRRCCTCHECYLCSFCFYVSSCATGGLDSFRFFISGND